MATIPVFNQWAYGDTLTFQLPVPTSLAVTATIRAVKPRSGTPVTWTGVVSDASDTVAYTFAALDLDEHGRWICEIVLSDDRTVLFQTDGVTRLMFDVAQAARSM